jgi:hypothetical protein
MFTSPGSRGRQQSFFSILLRRFPRFNEVAPSDGVELFARRRAGRYMLAQIGPSNVPYEFQPYLGGTKVGLATATGGGVTVSSVGISAPTASGTATTRIQGTTSLLTGTRRVGYVLASAAANLATGWSQGNAILLLGNSGARGGFFFHARFGFNALTSGNRHMVGMASATTTADPSAATNACFIGKDAADTNWQVMFNTSSGTCTKVDTGIAPVTDKIYDVFVFAVPNAKSIKFALLSYDDNGYVDASFEYEAFTNLPLLTALLFPRVLSGSGSATTGAAIDILQNYIESDF